MTYYLTFGPAQRVEWEEKVYNHQCVAVVNHNDEQEAEKLIEKVFRGRYNAIYKDDEWNANDIVNYPRGYVFLRYYEK
jgi:hypothetical protein